MSLVVATAITFLPALGGSLLHWDDTRYIVKNDRLRTAAGCLELWNPSSPYIVRAALQYYPVTFSSFCIEYQLVGTDPLLYHVTNLFLHLVNVALALLLARAMGASVWVAALAAAVFGLHPMQVASVAWVAERKNVLSGLFYFLTFLLYIRHRQSGSARSYRVALVAFLAALLSKTQTATLPVAIALFEFLVRDHGLMRRLSPSGVAAKLAPMLAMAFVAAVITAQIEGQAFQTWWDLPTVQGRPFVASSAAWFYVGKLLVPTNFAPIYPKWDISAGNPLSWFALGAWIVIGALVVRFWKRVPPLALWGSAQFVLALAPTLGLVPFAYQEFAYVADHFVYLSFFGAGLTLGVLADHIAGSAQWTARRAGVSLAAVLALVFCAVTARFETEHWRDDLALSQRAVERNPESHAANYKFGIHSFNKERSHEALAFIRKAYQMTSPNGFEYNRAVNKYFVALGLLDGPAAVADAATEELSNNPGSYVALAHRAASNQETGKTRQARSDYERVVTLAPPGSKWAAKAKQGIKRLGGAAPESESDC